MREKHVTVFGGLRRTLAVAAAATALSLACAGPASASYEAGLKAYQNGQFDQAIDIWKRFAVAGDVRSKNILGDVYSGKILEGSPKAAVPLEAIPLNNIEALKWYTLAAYHDFTAYQRPTAEEVNARILAEHRLPDIRARMSTADVSKAEKLVSDTFERGSPYDLYRLGDMYQRGAGVAKNNAKALTMFALAKSRGVGEASLAYEQLEKLMTKQEIKIAEESAASWQPPLPEEHMGQTTQQKELERLKKELEELKLEDALEAVSDIDVELIQRALRSLGLYFGSIDNAMGPATRDAIRRFQYSQVSSDTEMSEEDKEAVRTGVLSARQTVQLFREASKADHPMSQYVYGIMHVRGIGVEQNGQEAVNWLTKSSRANLAIAHYALGVIYRDGTTGLNEVTPDKSLAARHFARAFALGYKPAGDALKLLEFEAPRNVE
ncbi:MAG: peptidoglycan-binding protein [Amphiplicatus sp.]